MSSGSRACTVVVVMVLGLIAHACRAESRGYHRSQSVWPLDGSKVVELMRPLQDSGHFGLVAHESRIMINSAAPPDEVDLALRYLSWQARLYLPWPGEPRPKRQGPPPDLSGL